MCKTGRASRCTILTNIRHISYSNIKAENSDTSTSNYSPDMKLRLTYDEAIHKLLQIYQPPPPPVLVEDNVDEASSTLKDSSSQPEVINLENEETTSGVTCVESSSLSAGRVGTGEKSVSQASLRAAVCLGEACKKRASNDCIHK